LNMKKIFAVFFISMLSLLISETALRLMRFQPGILLPPQERLMSAGVNFVDTLYLTEMFKPDSNGIMVRNLEYDSSRFNLDFKHLPSTIKDMVYRYNFLVPINENGFQDVDFSTKKSRAKKKVMLLGDSFTWGYSAIPYTESFVNLLSREDSILTYNLGVPGADVATYLMLTKLYLKKIKPDVVIVNFFSNDFLDFKKELIPFQYSDLYPTNAGGLYKQNFDYYSNDSIELFETYQDAYNELLQKYTYEGAKSGWVKSIMKNSALVSQLYRILWGYNQTNVGKVRVQKSESTYDYMHQIQSMCQQEKADFHLVLINSGADKVDEIEMQRVFRDIPFTYPLNLDSDKDFYPTPDGHFNNSGHLKYKKHLLGLIKTNWQN